MDNLSTEELAISVNRVAVPQDSVFFYATQDTSGNPHSDLYGKCNVVHDSLRTEFIRLAGSAPRSYQDVFVLKERTSPYCDDKELADAADSIGRFSFLLTVFRPLLLRATAFVLHTAVTCPTLQDRIHNLTDLKTFIRDEDVMFRTFLAHLDDLAGEDMSDLTKDTERCCSLVFLATEKKEISYRDAMIYMAMRTNRRIIQNAVACLNDIREDKVKSRAQAFGYACMILQPYISMDGVCMALLSDTKKRSCATLREQTPEAFTQLGDVLQSDNGGLAELPGTLMGIYIRTL